MLRAIAIAGFLLLAGQTTEAITVPETDYRLAQVLDDPRHGQALAERYCFECHGANDAGILARFPPAPAFAGLDAHAYDRHSLTVVLVTRGHPDSVRAVLAPGRLDDLLAYIRSLQRAGAG